MPRRRRRADRVSDSQPHGSMCLFVECLQKFKWECSHLNNCINVALSTKHFELVKILKHIKGKKITLFVNVKRPLRCKNVTDCYGFINRLHDKIKLLHSGNVHMAHPLFRGNLLLVNTVQPAHIAV